MYPPAIPTRPPREPARPPRIRTLPTVPSTSTATDLSPPPYHNVHDNDSTLGPSADLPQIPGDDLPTLIPRSATSPQEMSPENELSGGARAGNKPSPTPKTPTTSRIRPVVSNPILSASPLSAHPESPAFAFYPYYMSSMFSVTTHSE